MSENWDFLPILSRRLLGEEKERKKSNRSVGKKLSICQILESLSKGRDNPRNILSKQQSHGNCDFSLAQFPRHRWRWGDQEEGGRQPKGPERHARPCKVRAYPGPRVPICGLLPVQSFPSWRAALESSRDEVQTFVTRRHTTALIIEVPYLSRYDDMASVSG